MTACFKSGGSLPEGARAGGNAKVPDWYGILLPIGETAAGGLIVAGAIWAFGTWLRRSKGKKPVRNVALAIPEVFPRRMAPDQRKVTQHEVRTVGAVLTLSRFFLSMTVLLFAGTFTMVVTGWAAPSFPWMTLSTLALVFEALWIVGFLSASYLIRKNPGLAAVLGYQQAWAGFGPRRPRAFNVAYAGVDPDPEDDADDDEYEALGE